MHPILLGIVASFFFAVTFILNHAMSLSGGSWLWSAALRFLFMTPFLLLLVAGRKGLPALLHEMQRHPLQWLLWSTVGFGFFYAPLCFSAAYGPGWLVAGTWQVTIISGALLSPFFYQTISTSSGVVKARGKVPRRGLAASLVILLGVALMQAGYARHLSLKTFGLGAFPVLLASFAYPLGNRKMMALCGGRLDSYQRVLGMTLASLPFWLLISFFALGATGVPGRSQILQSLTVAISSGVIATVLFFRATDKVKDSLPKLAAVEATQSLEVLFTIAGELALLGSALPSFLSWAGMLLVILGMTLHSYLSHTK